ncbi:MAG TPA: sigma 54-interacting transcriptional regulator [Acidobacteriota bacterium]|nr:sigma 54-interacting transcriptional regulator [Acidobacteriota bacterium]
MREPAADEGKKLTTLLELSQALSSALNLKHSLHRALEILESRHGMFRGTVTLQKTDSDLYIEASNGIGLEGQRAQYRLGEGIPGRVVESGKPVIIPQAGLEPILLNRAVKRNSRKDEVTHICVPIPDGRKTVGALGVDLKFKRGRDYDRTVKFLRVIAGIIGQAVRVERLVQSETRKLVEENIQLREELRERYDFPNMVGSSGNMRQVYEQIMQVAGSNTTVLIRGESGTGKELIAHAIHYNSPRANKPFVKVSCAALPETLIESELFGYEKGAFSGAQSRKPGRFELAEGGTLFLDEIGDLNPSIQIKLLRVLQEKEFERLGGTTTVKAKVRLITATSKNLEKAIAEEAFREDLYYRLNVFSIFIPPLRERKPDVMALTDYFLEKYTKEHGKNIKRISTPAIDMLMSYHWPGNVRELENAIERAVLICDGTVIHAHHLPPTLQTAEASGTVLKVSLTEAVSAYEKDLIMDALKTTRGNCSKAARLLSATERVLNYKVKKYAIDSSRFRK